MSVNDILDRISREVNSIRRKIKQSDDPHSAKNRLENVLDSLKNIRNDIKESKKKVNGNKVVHVLTKEGIREGYFEDQILFIERGDEFVSKENFDGTIHEVVYPINRDQLESIRDKLI